MHECMNLSETSKIPALDAAPRVTYLLWYNSWERLYATGVFTLTLVGFQPTKDYTFFVLEIFYIEFAFGFYKCMYYHFGPVNVLLSMLYYKWEMVAI